MGDDGNWLKNLADISETAKVAINRVSDAIGMVHRPTYVRRMAQAHADANRILAQGEVDANDIRMRAALRVEAEHVRHQLAIEDVTRKALPYLTDSAQPSRVSDDWLIHFFGLARDITNEEMHKTWGRILAGEFNHPGSLSRRTLNIVAQIDEREAKMFNTLCCFAIDTRPGLAPVMFDVRAPIYANSGLTFSGLSDLDAIGLLQFKPATGFTLTQPTKRIGVTYQGRFMMLEFRQDSNNPLQVGNVMLTAPGREVAAVCDVLPVEGFFEYLQQQWTRWGITVSTGSSAVAHATVTITTGTTGNTGTTSS